MSDVAWLAEHHEAGALHGRVGRDGDDLVAEWVGVATLRVRRDGEGVRFVPDPRADAETVAKIRRGSAQALLRHLRGELAIHGAAVVLGGGAVGFFAEAEAGKSTLAASLCVTRGAALVADDAIALERTREGFDVLPLETEHWLDGASRRALGLASPDEDDKRPVAAAVPAEGGAPLRALVHLVFADREPRLVPLAGIEALGTVLPQVIRFVVDDPALQRRELETLAALVERVPIYRLERPRSFDRLETSTTLVADLAKVRT